MNRQQTHHPLNNPRPLLYFREKTEAAPVASKEIIVGTQKPKDVADKNPQNPSTDEDIIKWEAMVQAGTFDSLIGIGYECLTGSFEPQDVQQAAKWFEFKANTGCAFSQFVWGQMLQMGIGKKKDIDEGMRMLTTSATQGCDDAQYLVAELLLEDPTSAVDSNNAIHWLWSATNQLHMGATLTLADCYRTGNGVPVNGSQALLLYRGVMHENHSVEAHVRVGMCYRDGVGVPKNMKIAKDIFMLTGRQGDPYACLQVGLCYSGIAGLVKCESSAFKWFERGAIGGNVQAIEKLQRCYTLGIGVAKNRDMATYWSCRLSMTPVPTQYEKQLKRLLHYGLLGG